MFELNKDELEQLQKSVEDIARNAGALVQEYAEKLATGALAVQKKADAHSIAAEVFTEADLHAQELILDGLQKISAGYDFGLLAEESSDDGSRLEKDYFWCVDPLDGTLAFTRKTAGYSVCIALVRKDGTPMIGVIFDPRTKTLYSAAAGCGAMRNGEPLTPGMLEVEGRVLHLISDPAFEGYKHFSPSVTHLKAWGAERGIEEVELTLIGGAAMNAMWVLEKKLACYFKIPKPGKGGGCIWDYAASACIYKEAGAWCQDSYGQPLDLNRPDSTYMNHRGVMFSSDKNLADELLQLTASLL